MGNEAAANAEHPHPAATKWPSRNQPPRRRAETLVIADWMYRLRPILPIDSWLVYGFCQGVIWHFAAPGCSAFVAVSPSANCGWPKPTPDANQQFGLPEPPSAQKDKTNAEREPKKRGETSPTK